MRSGAHYFTIQSPLTYSPHRTLEEHIAALTAAGLTADEAYMVAVRRVGRRRVEEPATASRGEFLVAVGLAIAAACAVKVPALFGLPIRPDEELPLFYFRNASLFVFPLLAIYFVWKRGLGVARSLWLALPFAAGALFANVFPFSPDSDTQALTMLHLPIALWLAVGFAYARTRWFAAGGRMDFVRFSGELAIYFVLIALGGGVVTGFYSHAVLGHRHQA